MYVINLQECYEWMKLFTVSPRVVTLTRVMRNKAKKKNEFMSTHFPIYVTCGSLWEILSRTLMKGSRYFRKTNKP